jgi:tetratricopeptide (TPR) repeat protein
MTANCANGKDLSSMWVSDSYEDIELQARTLLASGDYAGALEQYQRLSQRLAGLKPAVMERRPALRSLHVLSLAQQARIHHWQGDFEQALQIYQQLNDMAPDRGSTWRGMTALVRIDMGQTEEGLDALRAEAVASPGDPIAWLRIGVECEGLGLLEEAEANLRRAAANASTPESQLDTYLALFDFYRAQGRVVDALAVWDQAWADSEEGPAYVFPLYQMMWEHGHLDQARRYLRQEENPLRKGFYQGWLAASEDQADEAARHWQRVAEMNPMDFDDGQEAWAEAALRVDIPAQEVLSVIETVLKVGGVSSRVLLLKAIAEARLGHIDDAVKTLESVRNVRLMARPRREELPESSWVLLDELVSDEELKSQLHPFFEGCAADTDVAA